MLLVTWYGEETNWKLSGLVSTIEAKCGQLQCTLRSRASKHTLQCKPKLKAFQNPSLSITVFSKSPFKLISQMCTVQGENYCSRLQKTDPTPSLPTSSSLHLLVKCFCLHKIWGIHSGYRLSGYLLGYDKCNLVESYKRHSRTVAALLTICPIIRRHIAEHSSLRLSCVW
jgi:hypothetical protein